MRPLPLLRNRTNPPDRLALRRPASNTPAAAPLDTSPLDAPPLIASPLRPQATPLRLLVLFGKDWDHDALRRFQGDQAGRVRFHFEGFDLFSFPSNARLLNFDLWRFVDRIVQRYRGRIDGVVSNNEQFGALCAALVAQALGLPGVSPRAVVTCQHKLLARQRIAAVLPDAVPKEFAVLPVLPVLPFGSAVVDRLHGDVPIALPFFIKPVKATFSVLARPIDSPAALRDMLRFAPWETFLIKRLVHPFNQALRHFHPHCDIDAHHLIAETPMQGEQLNVDGAVIDGEVRLFGIVDEILHPGTSAFLRFVYPARRSAELRERVLELTRTILAALEFDHGCFNLEFFYDPARDALQLIEINPRMSTQTADFYRLVDGVDVYALNFALATRQRAFASCGVQPSGSHSDADTAHAIHTGAPAAGRFGVAASFVFRKFDGSSCDRLPSADDLAWLAQHEPDARLMLYAKSGRSLAREYKWLGSHRYAILNLAGRDMADLRQRFETICERLGWPCNLTAMDD